MNDQEKTDLREYMNIKFRDMESRLNARIDKIAHWQLAIAVVAHYFDLLGK